MTLSLPNDGSNSPGDGDPNRNVADDIRLALVQAAQLSRVAAARGAPVASVNLDALADRLTASVVRPLTEALSSVTEASASPVAAGPAAEKDAPRADQLASAESLWQLTRHVSSLAVRSRMPPQVTEAAAALQDLVRRTSPVDGPNGWTVRLAELRELQAPPRQTVIQASLNGPYLVINPTSLTNRLGEDMPLTPQMALCRCGASAIKPLCDGAHAIIGFASSKDPARVADRRDSYVGQQVSILDNRGTCQHSSYCTDRLATVFHLGSEPFVTPSGGRMDEIIRAVRDCPSGALSYAMDGREAREQVDYGGQREPSIEVSMDGPYRVTGGIALEDSEGREESRNGGASREHYALCRCGQSQNKPFCSGMHWYVGFHDPIPDSNHEPTIFEWCGGLPALTRMTRLFYEKYVPQDPLLAPLFADMSADHPQRVAKWSPKCSVARKRTASSTVAIPA